eukprot:TRINITY_DN687_c0_g1_i1.p6 TRINITY_DN687_c0_g1~~TRINITY_DN687_c0_g1_i1.p6  ORF type:complete len:155 (-),score=37.37 TRINITY_DN687_c0_g1_i1:2081-2545(-)
MALPTSTPVPVVTTTPVPTTPVPTTTPLSTSTLTAHVEEILFHIEDCDVGFLGLLGILLLIPLIFLVWWLVAVFFRRQTKENVASIPLGAVGIDMTPRAVDVTAMRVMHPTTPRWSAVPGTAAPAIDPSTITPRWSAVPGTASPLNDPHAVISA